MTTATPHSFDPAEWRDDRILHAQLRAGNAAALEWAYRTYVPQLLPFAFRYVRSREEAEEIVQSVFEKVWRERQTLVIAGTLAQYLFVAVRNRAYDVLRHESAVRRWQARVVQDVSGADTVPGAASSIEVADAESAVTRALAQLPERQRVVCTLRWIDGLSYAEIAQRLGVSPRTVETHIARAVERVRAELRGTLP